MLDFDDLNVPFDSDEAVAEDKELFAFIQDNTDFIEYTAFLEENKTDFSNALKRLSRIFYGDTASQKLSKINKESVKMISKIILYMMMSHSRMVEEAMTLRKILNDYEIDQILYNIEPVANC